MASKFVTKNFWNSCASLFQVQNIYRINKRRCLSVLNTKDLMTVLFEFIDCGVKMTRRLPLWRVYEKDSIFQWKVYERGIFSAKNGI